LHVADVAFDSYFFSNIPWKEDSDGTGQFMVVSLIDERAGGNGEACNGGRYARWMQARGLQSMQSFSIWMKGPVVAVCTARLLKGSNIVEDMTMLSEYYTRKYRVVMISLREAGLCYRTPLPVCTYSSPTTH
jgi:hypothetical protein